MVKIVNFISESLCIEESELISFAHTAPHRYKIYTIPKRSGNGRRTIAHPSKQLKFIQRLTLRLLQDVLPIHESALAYKKSISIRDNANIHRKNQYLLKMDFKDFFPSITPSLLFRELERKNIIVSDEDKNFLASILFFKLRSNSSLKLSIGAPSSPLISNFIMHHFDQILSSECKKMKICYTRYADDITFSTNIKDSLFKIPSIVKNILKNENYPELKVNEEKTVFSSKAHNRHVTGITITNEGALSVGREKRRLLSASLHRYIEGKIDGETKNTLKGQLSFAFFIEPQFKIRLQKKYGVRALEKLFSNE